jgi:acetolactate synthase-1/2/3 large subunit
LTTTGAAPPSAAHAVVRALLAHGVDRVFCVAGESYLALLDALFDTPAIDVVTSRHEGSAGFAALADAKLTRRPGVLLVNRGPGATNASIALHSARQDATPLVLVVGQVCRTEIGRASFQEMDHGAFFAGLAKAVWTVYEPDRAQEIVARSLRVAQAGTPGPTVVVIPEDVLRQPTPVIPTGRWRPKAPAVDHADVERCAVLLRAARRPLLIAGDRVGDEPGRQALRTTAARLGIPVVTSHKRQDLLDNDDPSYAGHLTLGVPAARRALLSEADIVLAIGTRLGSVTTQSFTLPDPGRQRLVHVYPDAEWIGHVYTPDLPVVGDPAMFLDALAAVDVRSDGWADWTRRLRRAETESAAWQPVMAADGVVFGAVVAAVDEAVREAVVTVDAGNFTSWVHRYLRMTADRRLLGIASSAMGFGVPAGIAAALRRPELPVITFVGDGGFLMTGTELMTAVHRHLRLVVVIADNGSYGTIRHHQERAYPGRTIATDLTNPDFAAMARAFGAAGLSVGRPEEIGPALKAALDCSGPAVLHVRTSLEWISAHDRLSQAETRS